MSFTADEYIAELRKMFAQPKEHPRAWAKRILDKHRAGESVLPIALRYALEVSGDVPSTREPGAD